MGTYIITGDGGFVGARLRKELLNKNHNVIGIDRRDTNDKHFNYKSYTIDLSDENEIKKIINSCNDLTAIFHLAAKLPLNDNEPLNEHLSANLRTTENIILALEGKTVPIIFSSTMSVFGKAPQSIPVSEDALPNPIDAYGITKLAAEYALYNYVNYRNGKAVVLRYSGIFGVGYDYGAINFYLKQVMEDKEISVYGNGTIIRDYIHVNDVVQANIIAAEMAPNLEFEVFHISGGSPLPLVDIAKIVVKNYGSGTVSVNDNPGTFDFAFSIEKAKKMLNFNPIPLNQRISEYIQNYSKLQL